MNKAWAEKYRPRKIEDLIFPDTNIENAVKRWYENGIIDQNVLLYGKPGTGKSSLIKILVNDFIKSEKDVFLLGRKAEDLDKLGGWIPSLPVASKFKIVVIEEIDRLSPTAFLLLKEKYMEKYQGQVAFLAATNNPHKIDPAVRTRFNLKINFNNLPQDKVLQRLEAILQQEGIKYNIEELKQFVSKHIRKGMRELLNLLQIASTSGVFTPSAVSTLAGITEEDNIIKLIVYFINFFKNSDRQILEVLYNNPVDPTYFEHFGKFWQGFNKLLINYPDIDYDYIYTEVINSNIPLNVKKILMNYYNDNNFKIFKHMHLASAIIEILEDFIKAKP